MIALTRFLAGLVLALPLGTAHALLLGGTEVPKDKVIVYLLIGHSNMAGVDTRLTDGEAHPRGWTYPWFRSKVWEPAKETPGRAANGLSGRGEGGPGMPFVKGMAEAFPGYYIGVVSNASVSCTLRGENEGNNGSGMPADSNRYWKGATLYNEIVAVAKEIQEDVTFGGILCMLGSVEATRTSEAICRAFSDDAAQMVADIRTELGLPNLPFIMGEYENGSTGSFALTRPWPAIIDEQIKLIPSKLAHSATVNSVGIEMRDDHHYTADDGQGEWARRAVEIIRTKGWGPGMSNSISRDRHSARSDFRHADGQFFLVGEGMKVLSVGGRLYLPDGKALPTLDSRRLR